MKIYLTALIRSTAGNATQMKVFLKELINSSTKEEACLQYELHQSTDDENQFIFHEIWTNQAGLDVHNNQPHIKKFIEQATPILDGDVIIHKTQIVH